MTRAIALGLLALVCGCTFGSDESETTPREIADARRAEIVAALDRALACWNIECTRVAFLQRQSLAVLVAIDPLDDALRGTSESKAELERLATATSALRHSALQLQSCFLISSQKHDGKPFLEECIAPVGEFRENLEYAKNALSR